jgi:hypothetical protein
VVEAAEPSYSSLIHIDDVGSVGPEELDRTDKAAFRSDWIESTETTNGPCVLPTHGHLILPLSFHLTSEPLDLTANTGRNIEGQRGF